MSSIIRSSIQRVLRLPSSVLLGLLTTLGASAAHAAAITVSPTKLTASVAGAAYSLQMSATGGKAPYTWSSSAALPAGLTLGKSNGLLSGAVATVGTYPITIVATDSVAATGQRALSLSVTAPKPLATQYATLDSLSVGTAYSKAVTATGGATPYSWSVNGGALPGGMSFTAAGVFSGNPTTPGEFKFSLTVTDANGLSASAAQDIWVSGPPLATQYAVLDSLTAGTFYSKTVTAVGGTLPYSWSFINGMLPPGMSLTPAGVFSGTPTTTGEYKFTLMVSDANSVVAMADQDLWVGGTSITSPGSGGTTTPTATPLATLYATLDPLTVGTAYTRTVSATGGTLPYAWSVTGGALPPGMTLTAGGVFSGTPTTGGDYKFSLTVTDAANATASAAQDVYVGGGSGSGGTTTPPAPTSYTATVVSGTGSGTYLAGATVTIVANTAPTGQAFSAWTGQAVASATSASTTFIMPAANATVTATYAAVTVTNPTPPAGGTAAAPTNPILFVTQVPIGMDFSTIGSTFSNQRPSTDSVGRGGDLYIRYPDGTVKNLTAAAGFGTATGFQGAGSIAVRDPSVHWSGTKAIFSMVVGAPTTVYGADPSTWQLYEITGFGEGQTPVITVVPNQPAGFNNIAPCYGTNGRILFTSDRPRNGQAQLYPQLDEYEMAPTVSGLWSMDPATGDLFTLDHTPSGAFTPSIDSFGRVIFTRWDHLQRDQEADIDVENIAANQALTYGTFNYSDETAQAQMLVGNRTEFFPEGRITTGNVNGHVFNEFFPWMINEDGTQEETINHIGAHEIGGFAARNFLDDTNLVDGFDFGARLNQTYLTTMLQIKEDPTNPGKYFGIDTPEFGTHASGMIVALSGPPTLNPDAMPLTYITYPVTRYDAPLPAPAITGKYREPTPLANGTLVAVYTPNDANETQSGVGSDYAYRLMTLQQSGTFYQPAAMLTAGETKTVSFYSNGALVSYTGAMWELNPVEVRSRPIPSGGATALPAPETSVFAEVGVSIPVFQAYMKANNLALLVSRNVTTRDHADHQQPYNLQVPGTTTQTVGAGGKIYGINSLQFFQGDQLRGLGIRNPGDTPVQGRRVLAQPMHDTAATAANPADAGAPAGSVAIAADGSTAAFVPARRAMTWQVNDPTGAAVVRERYWLTFQPGEIRSCTSCHGINEKDQAGNAAPVNEPAALRSLLIAWKAQTGN